MADYSSLISSIEAQIKENHNNEIDGPTLQVILVQMLRAINETKADRNAIPTRLADLQEDATHRVVTTTDINNWNDKTKASWSDYTVAHEGQPAVDNTVVLGLTNGSTYVEHALALATHSHDADTINGLDTLLENYVEITDLGFATGQVSQSLINVDSFLGLKVYNEVQYFALRNHSHNLQNLLNVTITNPVQGQVLKYNGTGWINGADSGVSHLYELTGDVLMTPQSYADGQIPILQKNNQNVPFWRNTGYNYGNFGRPVYIKNNILTPIGFLDIHPEASEIIVPFLFNDISFLQSRGGSCTIQGVTNTPNLTALFNGKSDYCMLEVSAMSTAVSITIGMPTDAVYNYTNHFYIDFGTEWWAAQTISATFYDANNNIIQGASRSVTGLTGSFWKPDAIELPAGTEIKKIVIVCSNFRNTTPRISEIGLVKFDSEGIAKSFMSRGSNDDVWRSIIPAKNNTYDLGSAAAAWSNMYVTFLRAIEGIYTKAIYSETDKIDFYVTDNGSPVKVAEMHKDTAYFNHLLPRTGSTYNLGAANDRWDSVYAANGFFSGDIYADNGMIYLYNRMALQDNKNGTFIINYDGRAINAVQYYGRSHTFTASNNGNWNEVLSIAPDNVRITKPLMPAWDGATSLGIHNYTFAKLYAQKWYITSSQTDDPAAPHIEWDAVNNSFKVVGNLYATGFITALKTGSGTVSLSIYNNLVAMRSGLLIGTDALPFDRVYTNYLGSTGRPVTNGYFTNLNVVSTITADRYAGGKVLWGDSDNDFKRLLDGNSHYDETLSDYGITTNDLAALVSGEKTKITLVEYEDTDIYLVTEAHYDNGLYTIHFGSRFRLVQTSAYLFDLYAD